MRNVLEYLEAAAKKNPNKTAIAYKDDSLTFDQLYRNAQGLAHAILSVTNGISKMPIAVISSRDINTVVYFLATLYSGNFYVPIDPDLPMEKTLSILKECKPAVLLGNSCYQEYFHRELQCEYITFLSIEAIEEASCSIPYVGNDDPLYLIYTSGSTGKPKGVLKSHAQEISFIETYCETFCFSEEEIIGNQTPFFFDASAKDFYMMLKLGCTLEILPTSLFSLPPELIDYLNQKRITFISWVPTALSLVAQLNPFSLIKPSFLKKVFFVGEVMPMKHLNKWRKALPNLQYVNLYGQTEIAGICAYHEVKEAYEDTEVLPIGKALSNCSLFLMENGKPIWEKDHIGEIYIASEALATGYFLDAEKTEQSFVFIDFGYGSIRCFKTGDLAYFNHSGDLVFASRADYQIKHLGHRIELGEIEAIAGSLKAVDRCCCLYHATKRKIYLFCQLNSSYSSTPFELLSELKDKLSAYMLPNKIIVLDKLPLNANGKIDRQALKNQM